MGGRRTRAARGCPAARRRGRRQTDRPVRRPVMRLRRQSTSMICSRRRETRTEAWTSRTGSQSASLSRVREMEQALGTRYLAEAAAVRRCFPDLQRWSREGLRSSIPSKTPSREYLGTWRIAELPVDRVLGEEQRSFARNKMRTAAAPQIVGHVRIGNRRGRNRVTAGRRPLSKPSADRRPVEGRHPSHPQPRLFAHVSGATQLCRAVFVATIRQ